MQTSYSKDVVSTFKTNPLAVELSHESGTGAFSAVSVTECGEYAVKKSSSGNGMWLVDGWVLYAAYCMHLPPGERENWMPQIYSLKLDLNGKLTALMDCYEPDYAGFGESENVHGALQSVAYRCERGEVYEQSNIDLIRHMKFLYDLTGVPLMFDMHSWNRMFDPRTEHEIITDPIVIQGWWSEQGGSVLKLHGAAILAALRMFAEKNPNIEIMGEQVEPS